MATVNADLLRNNSANITNNFINNQKDLLLADKQLAQSFANKNQGGYNVRFKQQDNSLKNAVARNFDFSTGEFNQKGLIGDLSKTNPEAALQMYDKFRGYNQENKDSVYNQKIREINLKEKQAVLNEDRAKANLDFRLKEQEMKSNQLDMNEKSITNISKMLSTASSPNQIKRILMTAAGQGIDINSFTGGLSLNKLTDENLEEIRKSALNLTIGAQKNIENQQEELKLESELRLKEAQTNLYNSQAENQKLKPELDQAKLDLQTEKAQSTINNQNSMIKTREEKKDILQESIFNKDKQAEITSLNKELTNLNKAISTNEGFDQQMEKSLNLYNDFEKELFKEKLDHSPLGKVKAEAATFARGRENELFQMYNSVRSNELMKTLTQMKANLNAIGQTSDFEAKAYAELDGLPPDYRGFIRLGEAGPRRLKNAIELYKKAQQDYNKKINEAKEKKSRLEGRLNGLTNDKKSNNISNNFQPTNDPNELERIKRAIEERRLRQGLNK